jgi:hypothetical protein
MIDGKAPGPIPLFGVEQTNEFFVSKPSWRAYRSP